MTTHNKVQALARVMNHYTPAQDYYFINRIAYLAHDEIILCPAQIDRINTLYDKYYGGRA